MKKITSILLLVLAVTSQAQNVQLPANQPHGEQLNPQVEPQGPQMEQQQFALNNISINNDNSQGNEQINVYDNPQVQIQTQQIQVKQINIPINYNNPQQQQYVNRGNVSQNPGHNPVNQQKYGQSIKLSGSSGGGYSGSSSKVKKSSKKNIAYKIKKMLSGKGKYKSARHYGKKKRVKQCSRFK